MSSSSRDRLRQVPAPGSAAVEFVTGVLSGTAIKVVASGGRGLAGGEYVATLTRPTVQVR